MACKWDSQVSNGKSSHDEGGSRVENLFPGLHVKVVAFVCVFHVGGKIGNEFGKFCTGILKKRSEEIHTFIREQIDNPDVQDCAILRLCSQPSTYIVMKEEEDGFTAHIYCQKEPDSPPAITWISNLANDFGYTYQGVHEKGSIRDYPDAATTQTTDIKSVKEVEEAGEDMVVLPSTRYKMFKMTLNFVIAIFRSCVCSDNDGSVEEAYEEATQNDQQIAICNGDQTELKAKDPASMVVFDSGIERAHERNYKIPGGVPTGRSANYQLLLHNIADSLQFEEVSKLRMWVTKNFKVDVTSEWKDQPGILKELDKQKIINPTNLQEIKKFFQEVQRFDVVHLIDCYLDGDYSLLKARINSRNCCFGTDSHCSSAKNEQSGNQGRSVNFDGKTQSTRSVNEQDATTTLDMGRNKHSDAVGYVQKRKGFPINKEPLADSSTDRKMLSKSSQVNCFSRDYDSSHRGTHDNIDEGPWLCKHYKRRCHVKFDCCNEYWPCHRCHNNESKCGRKKLKSRDIKSIKCTRCGTKQQFGERSQFCIKCNLKFAKYFCASCKHLTGTDDHPYHCSKCGICRIHGDRSFHCDDCGVCLDMKLKNHKCRPGSAHDECCICLEDAFSGCQILPCSHKVHKDCATLMIRSGITRCPICRESFAHRLGKRPKEGAKQ